METDHKQHKSVTCEVKVVSTKGEEAWQRVRWGVAGGRQISAETGCWERSHEKAI